MAISVDYTAAIELKDRQHEAADTAPSVSVIVPAHNSASTLDSCLTAICKQLGDGDELIVVDDGSTDETSALIARFPARRAAHARPRGVAAARNAGARLAAEEVLFFVDADVVLRDGALDRARDRMADPSIDAVIGSYDDEPAAQSVVSLFKNLAHHYFHQRAAGPVDTFWGACGLVRRSRFFEVGGFNEERFPRPSIEDVELGWRLADAGARMQLDPGLQVTHLKRWTLTKLVTTDLRQRAIPWMQLALARGGLSRELNVSADQRVAAVIALLLAGGLISAPVWPPARIALPFCAAAAVLINRKLYALFWRKGGVRLAVGGFLLQQLYYLYSVGGAIAGVVAHVL
jgi:GT2 family glycosyltransferase